MRFRCHGCGTTVDAANALPFRCPQAGAGDDIDHVLIAEPTDSAFPSGSEQNPFLRYRALLSPYQLARAAGLSDAAWGEIVEELDAALVAVDGRGFRVTPMIEQKRLAAALGLKDSLWVKDETANVSGSHKARHLMGVMLYLRVLEITGLPAGEGLRVRRLAIASCGNAALAAAVIARAADWPLDVFIPPDAGAAVKQSLQNLGARITVCERQPGEIGDPCVRRFREAVAQGAIPFGVQGTENGLAIEGGRTLAFEVAEAFAAAGGFMRSSSRSAAARPGERAGARVRNRQTAWRRFDSAQVDSGPDRGLRTTGARVGQTGWPRSRRSGASSLAFHVGLGNAADKPRQRYPRRRDLRLVGRGRRHAREWRAASDCGRAAVARASRCSIPIFRLRRPAPRASPAF